MATSETGFRGMDASKHKAISRKGGSMSASTKRTSMAAKKSIKSKATGSKTKGATIHRAS